MHRIFGGILSRNIYANKIFTNRYGLVSSKPGRMSFRLEIPLIKGDEEQYVLRKSLKEIKKGGLLHFRSNQRDYTSFLIDLEPTKDYEKSLFFSRLVQEGFATF